MLSIELRGRIWWWRLRFSDGTDLRRSTGEFEKMRAEKAAFQAVRELDLDDLEKQPQGLPTLSSLRQYYLDWAGLRLAPASVSRTKYAFLALEKYMGEGAKAPGRREAENFLKDRVKKVKPVSADGDISHLRVAFNVLVKEGLVKENPFRDVRPLRAPKRERSALSAGELRAVLDAANGEGADISMACHLAGLAGFRRGEVEACRWDWFDLESRMIRIPCDHHFTPKGRRGRNVPMHPLLAERLREMPDREGRLISTDGMPRKAWTRVRKTAGVSIPFHSLRHTCATLWAATGVPVFSIQAWLGHASITTTQGYVHAASQVYDERVAFQLPEPAKKECMAESA